MKRLVAFVAVLVLATLFAVNASAEQNATPKKEKGILDGKIVIKATGSGIAPADVEHGGDVAIANGGVDLSYRLPWIKAEFGYTASNYFWGDVGALPFGNGQDDPWNTLHRLRLSFEHSKQLSRDWGYLVSATGTAGFEKEMDGSFGGAFRAGGSYRIIDELRLLFGAAVFVNEINTRVFPVVVFNYHDIDEQGQGFYGTVGFPFANVGYSFSRDLKLSASIGQDSKTYRLADDSDVQEKGYITNEGIVTKLTLDWSPVKNLTVSVGPDFSFNRNLKIYNEHGDKQDNYSVDPAFGGTAAISYKF